MIIKNKNKNTRERDTEPRGHLVKRKSNKKYENNLSSKRHTKIG